VPAEVRLTPIAARQAESAFAWWRQNRPAAPELLEEEFERAISVLSSHPLSGPVLDDPAYAEVRRVSLSRVRYHIYYRLRGERTVEIVAFWHSGRGEGPPLDPPA
jgi:plasmid stabilization system protein ParE